MSMESLPLEILQEIFKHAYRSVTLDEWNKVLLPNFCVVSSQWCAAAERCPALWTSIFVTEKSALRPTAFYTESTLPEPSLLLPFTTAAFLRSGDLPLDIVIHFPDTPYHYPLRPVDGHYFSHNHALVLSTLLHANSRRIASLEIHGETYAIKRNALQYLSQRIMPVLSRFVDVGVTTTGLGRTPNYQLFSELDSFAGRLAILQHPHCRTPPGLATVDAWGKSTYPVLEELELCGVSYNWDVFPSIQGLRKLSLRNQPEANRPSSPALFAMLTASAHTLQHLELTDIVYRNKHSGPLVVLENLQSLSIGYHLAHEPVWLLGLIRTPALRELSLVRDPHGLSSDSDSGHSSLIKTIIRTLPIRKLRKLSLDGVVFPTSSAYKIRIPANTDDILPEARTYWRELGVPKLPDCAATFTLFVFLLRQLPELQRLCIREVKGADFGGIARWTGCLGMLESLDVDVVGSDGFAGFLNGVTQERRRTRKELKVRVGRRLGCALEERRLYFDETVEVVVGGR